VPNEIITPSTIARVGLATLYNTTVLAGLVWRDFDEAFTGKQGDTITIRRPAVFEAMDFNRATGIVLQDINEDGVPVKLDHLADVSFPVTAEELTLSIDDFAGRLLTPAMEAIVQSVDAAIAAAAVEAATGPGGGGTVTMDTKASDVMIDAREVLTRNKLPARAPDADGRGYQPGGHRVLQGPHPARGLRLRREVQAGCHLGGHALRHRADPSRGRGRTRHGPGFLRPYAA
jgi:hypothetical protein